MIQICPAGNSLLQKALNKRLAEKEDVVAGGVGKGGNWRGGVEGQEREGEGKRGGKRGGREGKGGVGRGREENTKRIQVMAICADENRSFGITSSWNTTTIHQEPFAFLTFSSHRTGQELNSSFLCAFGHYPEVSGTQGEGSYGPCFQRPEPLLSDPPKIRPSQDNQERMQAYGPRREQTVSVDPRKMTYMLYGGLKCHSQPLYPYWEAEFSLICHLFHMIPGPT